ncbi:GTP 3',8-cyclase MoaA [Pyrofollis japonicus]|nr:GTP 3',8-cyclase MoaA [Pyrofollis japonicus]
MEGYKESHLREIELSLEEIELLKEAADRLDIKAFKITGGEPTLREDLVDIVRILKRNNAYVSLTTNASLLHKHLPGIADAGIDHINVSLHALDEERFRKITRSSLFRRVIENLKLLKDYNIPIKINFVILRGLNEQDIPKVIDLAADLNAMVQFIELHPVGKAIKTFKNHYLPRWRIVEMLENRIISIEYRLGLHNRPIITLDNGVRVELVGPVGNYLFCAGCTRIRVTYDFKLLPCLNWRGEPVEVRPRIANASTREEKVEKIIEAIREANSLRKPFVMYPLDAKLWKPGRKWKTMRLGLPKRDGRMMFTGKDGIKHLTKYLEEWGKYALS